MGEGIGLNAYHSGKWHLPNATNVNVLPTVRGFCYAMGVFISFDGMDWIHMSS